MAPGRESLLATQHIHELLKESPYAGLFEGGIFMHSFLNTFNYHRQHTPVDDKIVEARTVGGQICLEVTVANDPETGKPKLKGQRRVTDKADGSLNATVSAPDHAGYQFLQHRGLIVLVTKIGYVAVLPIGMAQVSSYNGRGGEGVKEGGGDFIFSIWGVGYCGCVSAKQ